VWNLVCGGFYGTGDLVKPVIIDSTALIDGHVVQLIEDGIIDNRILIPRCVLDQLRSMVSSGHTEKRNIGRRALDNVALIRNSARHFEIPKIRLADENTMDFVLTAYAKNHDTKIITISKAMEKAAQIEGVPVVNLKRLFAQAHTSEPAVGEEHTVLITRTGENPGQGVGSVAEHMIIVENADRDVNNKVRVKITKRVVTQGGVLFFAQKN
jgi:uncharacterized protein YacL